MSTVHLVSPDDDCTSIAARYGYKSFDDIYRHADNEDLRGIRPNPHVLFSGDKVHIPAVALKPLDLKEKSANKFKVTLPRRKFKLVLRDEEKQPRAELAYRLLVGEVEIEGKTKGDGSLEHDIPALEPFVALYLPDQVERRYYLGRLNPMRDAEDGGRSGVAQRLVALGFNAGENDGSDREKLEAAIFAFEDDRGMEVTGRISDALIDALEKDYGS